MKELIELRIQQTEVGIALGMGAIMGSKTLRRTTISSGIAVGVGTTGMILGAGIVAKGMLVVGTIGLFSSFIAGVKLGIKEANEQALVTDQVVQQIIVKGAL